jgi:hypothetical protein
MDGLFNGTFWGNRPRHAPSEPIYIATPRMRDGDYVCFIQRFQFRWS